MPLQTLINRNKKLYILCRGFCVRTAADDGPRVSVVLLLKMR